jgi:hypothetical protein
MIMAKDTRSGEKQSDGGNACITNAKKNAEAVKEANKTVENNIPPCGCAIGDLFAVTEQIRKLTIRKRPTDEERNA